MIGKRFNRLTIIEPAPNGVQPNGKTYRMWKVRCDCGTICVRRDSTIKKGDTASCGCIKKITGPKNATIHGFSKPGGRDYLLYATWRQMIHRCLTPTNVHFKDYGGRGIKVCESWIKSFESFKNDMGPKPSKRHSLERGDNGGNYEPGNVTWQTKKVQAVNTRRNRWIEYRGEKRTISQWADFIGAKRGSFYSRIKRGVPMGKIMTTPFVNGPQNKF